MITVTRAKQEYGLNETDLEGLECTYSRNPHYRSAPSMRLYDLADIIEASDKKDEERERKLAHGAEERAERMKADKLEATSFMQGYVDEPGQLILGQRQDCALPIDVLGFIMRKVAQSYEPDGIRGPGIVVKDLCNACLAFQDMRDASRDGFAELGQRFREVPGLDAMLQNPLDFKVADLQKIARAMTLAVGGTKAEVASRIVRGTGVSSRPPAWVPSAVIRAVHIERFGPVTCNFVNELKTISARGMPHVSSILDKDSLREIRDAAAVRWPDMPTLRAAAARHMELRRADAAKDLEHRRAANAARYLERRRATSLTLSLYGDCKCGNKAAQTCEKNMCGICCVQTNGWCSRHRVYD